MGIPYNRIVVQYYIREKQIDTDALCSLVIGREELEERFVKLASDRGDLIKVIVELKS